MSRQKELDADSKAIQQIEFLRQLKNPDNAIVANESMFVLALLEEKNLSKTTTQLNKLKFEIRINKKNFQDEELLHKLLLTARQLTKINAFPNNMSRDIKLVKLKCLKQFNQVDLLVLG